MSMPHAAPGGPQPIALPGVKHIVAVASGKGGVGKSTVAANLGLALRAAGHGVGLMDADIYGPSLPTLMGVTSADWPRTPQPLERYGLKLMSMGLLIEPDQAAAMRGPMIHKYLTAFLTQFEWGTLDYLLVDMPPGTGDAQLSLAQIVPVSGAVVVTTPQEVSVAVVRRGLTMFRTVRVPILGIVENMSYFVCDQCGKRHDIFRQGGGERCARELGVPFLGALPLDPRVAAQGDLGDPIVHSHPSSSIAETYRALAARVQMEVEKLASSAKPMPKLEL
jgi:ATP-binding protein involved in chromosome partitioning